MENTIETAKEWMKDNGELVEKCMSSWCAADYGLSPVAYLLFTYAAQFRAETVSDESDKNEFMSYLSNARNEFVVGIFEACLPLEHEDKIKLRVVSENILIAFDQLRDRYAQQFTAPAQVETVTFPTDKEINKECDRRWNPSNPNARKERRAFLECALWVRSRMNQPENVSDVAELAQAYENYIDLILNRNPEADKFYRDHVAPMRRNLLPTPPKKEV